MLREERAQGAGAGGKGGGAGNNGLDVRALKGLDSFDGSNKAWRDWAVVARSYASVMNAELGTMMKAAEQNPEGDVRNVTMANDMQRQASRTLFTLLLHSVKGVALDKVINSGEGEGIQAWRNLVERYEPKALARQAGTLQALLQWSFAGDILERLESWEREVARYEAISKEVVSSGVRIGIVLRQLEESPLKQHLVLNSERLKTWKTFVEEVVQVRTALNAATSGSSPMDIGGVSDAKCWRCGKTGHYEKDCYANVGGKNNKNKGSKGKSKGKVHGKNKSKGGKGDKGKQRAVPGDGKCFKCGGNHMKKDCPNRVHGLGDEEDGWQEDSWQGGWDDDSSSGGHWAWHDDGWQGSGVNMVGAYSHGIQQGTQGAGAASSSTAMVPPPPAPLGQQTQVGSLGGLFITSLMELGEMNGLEAPGVNSVDGEFEEVVFGVDSGSTTTVCTREVGASYPIDTTKRNRYIAANKGILQTDGLRHLVTEGGGVVRSQVSANLSKNLMAVAELCDAGFDVSFSNTKGNRATHAATGAVLPITRVGKVFDAKLKIRKQPSFTRQGPHP